MKISIVTISFNQVRFIEQTICSVLSQGYKNVEYIVVDAGSTDGSREIIERYRNRIDHILFEPDKGPADGLNKGFSVATGDIFGFLNSDDYLLPDALSTLASSFSCLDNKDVISGNAFVVNEEGTEINHFYSRRYSLIMRAYDATALAQQSTFFRSSVFRRVGGFNINNFIAWDGELWIDLALSGAKFGRISNFLSAFRVYEDSITGSGAHREAYELYKEAMFRKIMGKDMSCWDKAFSILVRGIGYIGHPQSLFQRIRKGPIVKV